MVLTLWSGCRDLTPIEIEQANVAVDASTPRPTLFDGGRTDGDAADEGCESCLFGGGGCNDLISACFSDTVCESIVVCMLDTGCYDGPGGEEASRCGLPCVMSAGVLTTEDPGLVKAIEVAICAGETCSSCFQGQP